MLKKLKTLMSGGKSEALEGTPTEQYALGLKLATEGAKPQEVLKLLTAAAEGGSPDAQYAVGTEDRAGDSISKDFKKARFWLQKAAEQNHKDACFELALMIADNALAKDSAEALRWFQKSAELGHSDGQYLVGTFYLNGTNLPIDINKAEQWFLKAAASGQPDAQYKIGMMRLFGPLPFDADEAAKFLKLASDRDHPEGQLGYAFLLESGLGVEKELDLAKQFYDVARSRGLKVEAGRAFFLAQTAAFNKATELKLAQSEREEETAERPIYLRDSIHSKLPAGETFRLLMICLKEEHVGYSMQLTRISPKNLLIEGKTEEVEDPLHVELTFEKKEEGSIINLKYWSTKPENIEHFDYVTCEFMRDDIEHALESHNRD